MAEVVEEVVEKTAEGFEEAAEITRRLDGRALGFFAAGVGVGAVISYFVTTARLETKYQKFADEQIDEMRETFRQRYSDLDRVRKDPKPALNEIVEELGYKGEDGRTNYSKVEQAAIDEIEAANQAPDEATREVHNVFETPGTEPVNEWDYATEVKQRVAHLPYIIHVDEFQQNEGDYEQITYTYYESDQVLADVSDVAVDNLEQLVGFANIKFGHGSQDPNIVYVRNDRLHLDIEITKDEGSYGEQVHGIIRHSARDRRQRPIRGFDDD